jgi:hypothetical protein
MGRIIPYIMENEKCLKPPTRFFNHHLSTRSLHFSSTNARVSAPAPLAAARDSVPTRCESLLLRQPAPAMKKWDILQ